MTVQTRSMTATELLELPRDGIRRELVNGEVREMAPAGGRHGFYALEIASELRNYVREHDLGRTFAAETGFKLTTNPDTVRAPDAAFVSKRRVVAAEESGDVAGYWPDAPDLAVEVVSPNDTHTEVTEKSLAWLAAGCRMVLAVSPENATVTVYRSRRDIRILTDDESIDGAEVVPGWTLPLATLFDRR